MTALPRVEDLPEVILTEDRADEDVVHVPCCNWRELEKRGEPQLALCGIDLSNHEHVHGPVGEDEWCQVCKVIDERPCEWDRKTQACVDCPQTLFNPR